MFEALAKKVCRKSTHHQHRHAAFVVVGGSIQSVGYNVGDTHAEIKAIQQIWRNKLKGAKMYSFRWRKNGTLGMAKPCPKCEQEIRDCGIKTVYYSDGEGNIQKMKL